MNDEVFKILLDRNLSFLEQIASTTMTWWVSSIVFCPTIIALFLYHRERIAQLPYLNFVCFVVSLFILSLPVYASWVIYCLWNIENEIKDLLMHLGNSDKPPFALSGTRTAIEIGGSCFIAAFILWCIVWRDLLILKKKCNKGEDRIKNN